MDIQESKDFVGDSMHLSHVYLRTLFASFDHNFKVLKVSIQITQVAPAKIF